MVFRFVSNPIDEGIVPIGTSDLIFIAVTLIRFPISVGIVLFVYPAAQFKSVKSVNFPRVLEIVPKTGSVCVHTFQLKTLTKSLVTAPLEQVTPVYPVQTSVRVGSEQGQPKS